MVRFAGRMAVFGFWFLVGQWALLALLVVLLGIAGATGSMPFPIGAAEVLTWLALAGAVLWLGHLVRRSLQRCRSVALAPDGTWILRNSIGRELGRIDRNTPREVRNVTERVMSLGPSVSFWTRTHASITTRESTWPTCHSIPQETARAVAQLRRAPFA